MREFERLEPRRLRAAGDLDPTFGDGGVFTYENAGDLSVDDLESLPDGRFIVAGGILGDNDGPDFALRRFNADGTPDTSFGGGDGIADGRLVAESAIEFRDI